MTDVIICDGIRTPVGRYGGSLSSVRTDDLTAIPIRLQTSGGRLALCTMCMGVGQGIAVVIQSLT